MMTSPAVEVQTGQMPAPVANEIPLPSAVVMPLVPTFTTINLETIYLSLFDDLVLRYDLLA